MRCRIVAALLLALAAAAGAQDREGELEDLRRAIEQHRDRVTSFERRERGVLEVLEEMDRALRALGRDAGQAREQAEEARRELLALEGRTKQLTVRLEKTRRALAVRAVALYKAGELGPVAAMFSAASFRDALARMQALRRVVLHDQRLIDRFESDQRALELARADAERVSAEREEAAARMEQRAGELDRERAARRLVLREVRSDRRRARATLNELEAAARALEETLAALRDAPDAAPPDPETPFAALMGRLEPPVEASVIAGFGKVVDREFQTETLRKGIEFGTGIGDPVYAVADGAVRYAGWFRGYGRIVILDHGEEFFTVTGHLGDIAVAVGDVVRAGDRLATAGQTGSLKGPRLYFEIRRGAEALDPARWLARGAGR